VKTHLHLAFPTGHVYELATAIVANNRAAFYHNERNDEFPTMEAALADTTALFEDSSEITDWLMGNMNPEEYLPHARLVRFTRPGLDPNDAEITYHDAPALIGQLDEATVLDLPVEMVLSAMAVHNRVTQMALLNDENGQPNVALVFIQGGPAVIGFFQGGIQELTDNVVRAMQGAAAARQQQEQGDQPAEPAAAANDTNKPAGDTPAGDTPTVH
jgi:hypothetical protein